MTQNKLMDISINVTKFSCFNLFSSGDLQSQQESKERQRTIKHKLCLESSIENLICAPINYYNQIVALLRPWKMQHFIMNGFLWKAKRNHDNILNCIHLWVVLFFLRYSSVIWRKKYFEWSKSEFRTESRRYF